MVLYFVATVCPGCEPGSSDLAGALQSPKLAGVEALGIDVSVSDRPADLRAFIRSTGIAASAPIQWGIDTTGAIATAYHVQALETTVIIDPQGRIAYRSNSSIAPDQLAQIVKELVLFVVSLAAVSLSDLLRTTIFPLLRWVQPVAALLLVAAGSYIVWYQN